MVPILQCGTFFYTGKNKGVFLFISKLLIIDFVRTDKFVLIRPNNKLNLFSGCADNHNINTKLSCTCNSGIFHDFDNLQHSVLGPSKVNKESS